MSSQKLLAQFDQDEALAETHHDAVEALDEGDSRRSFLKKAGLGGAAVMGSGALLAALTPAGAMAASGKGRPPASFGKGDVGILNYALTLEYLEAAFYNEATKNKVAKGAEESAFEADHGRRERPRRVPQEGARQEGRRGSEGRLRLGDE
jgi:hypothetical protein